MTEKMDNPTLDWKILAGVASLFMMLGGGVASSVLFIVKGDASAELSGATTQAIVQRIEADVNRVQAEVSALNRLGEAVKANVEQTRRNGARIDDNRREFDAENRTIKSDLSDMIARGDAELRRELEAFRDAWRGADADIRAELKALSARASNRYTSEDAEEDRLRLKRWQDDIKAQIQQIWAKVKPTR